MDEDLYGELHRIDTEGGPLSVRESGDRGAPPLLLLHGAMYDESRLVWLRLAPLLARYRRVIALDFPRHGGSRPWSGFVGGEILRRAVDDALRALALPPLPLAGLSMGGAVAIGYALERPERVTGLVLMGPGGLGRHVANQFLSWAFVKAPGAVSALTRYYGRLPREKMRRLMASFLHDGASNPELERLTGILAEEAARKREHREKAMDDWQLEGLAPFRLKFDYLPELHRLSCPSLWLRGKEDPLVGQAVMEEAAASAPSSKLVAFEDAGHLLPLERPEAVEAEMAAFFKAARI